MSVVDKEKCTGCKTCVQLCPVAAIALVNDNGKSKAFIDGKMLFKPAEMLVSRSPEEAIGMRLRSSPLEIGIDNRGGWGDAYNLSGCTYVSESNYLLLSSSTGERNSGRHFWPGAKTPEDVAPNDGGTDRLRGAMHG